MYPTGTILDHAQQPATMFTFLKRPPAPTALELAVAAQAAAERDLLEHSTKEEYHAAMRAMLKKRSERLNAEIDRLRRASGQAGGAPATMGA